jgi:2-keto-4-pentenoate hydratase/2-oxohepta-3-ene-1,7-dioic acid hydratase in catechol pathway
VKLVTYSIEAPFGSVDHLGVLQGEEIVDLNAAYKAKLVADDEPEAEALATLFAPPSMLELLRREERGLAVAREAQQFAQEHQTPRFPLADVKLRAPLPRPNTIRDFMVVEEHVRGSFKDREVPEEWYEIPVYYKGNPDSVIGPEDDVCWPAYTERLDYELELCAVIGKRGREISEAEAPGYVAGYTIFPTGARGISSFAR